MYAIYRLSTMIITRYLFYSYKSNWIRVERTREQHTLDLHMGVPWETVTLTAIGRDKSIYFDILEEGKVILNVLHSFYLLIEMLLT